jgi:anti-sigma factor ChrR (cupin superfamily)
VRAVAARYAESTGRLENALRTAAALRAATTDDAAQRDRELADRQQALDHVLALLDEATAGAIRASDQDPSRPG